MNTYKSRNQRCLLSEQTLLLSPINKIQSGKKIKLQKNQQLINFEPHLEQLKVNYYMKQNQIIPYTYTVSPNSKIRKTLIKQFNQSPKLTRTNNSSCLDGKIKSLEQFSCIQTVSQNQQNQIKMSPNGFIDRNIIKNQIKSFASTQIHPQVNNNYKSIQRPQLYKSRPQLYKSRPQINKSRLLLNKSRPQINKSRLLLNKSRAQINKYESKFKVSPNTITQKCHQTIPSQQKSLKLTLNTTKVNKLILSKQILTKNDNKIYSKIVNIKVGYRNSQFIHRDILESSVVFDYNQFYQSNQELSKQSPQNKINKDFFNFFKKQKQLNQINFNHNINNDHNQNKINQNYTNKNHINQQFNTNNRNIYSKNTNKINQDFNINNMNQNYTNKNQINLRNNIKKYHTNNNQIVNLNQSFIDIVNQINLSSQLLSQSTRKWKFLHNNQFTSLVSQGKRCFSNEKDLKRLSGVNNNHLNQKNTIKFSQHQSNQQNLNQLPKKYFCQNDIQLNVPNHSNILIDNISPIKTRILQRVPYLIERQNTIFEQNLDSSHRRKTSKGITVTSKQKRLDSSNQNTNYHRLNSAGNSNQTKKVQKFKSFKQLKHSNKLKINRLL